MLSASTNIKNKVNAGKLKDRHYEDYYKYGSHISKSITGSKNFWKGKYLDLLAIIAAIGFTLFFITLTANDSWPGLKIILTRNENGVLFFIQLMFQIIFFRDFFCYLKK